MKKQFVNNAFYDGLGQKWYDSFDHPIALLRAENKARAPWVSQKVKDSFNDKKCNILDIGCGAGFLSNALARDGHTVSGIDLSEESLRVAEEQDMTRSVCYRKGDAYALPYENNQFEVVCAMDLLEHVEEPDKVIKEASRVLKPGGILFFHTFNRNLFSWLFALKGMEWFVPNTPANIHIYRLFIKPKELEKYLAENSFKIREMFGLMPVINRGFFKLLLQKRISPGFAFKRVPSVRCGYMGYAVKK